MTDNLDLQNELFDDFMGPEKKKRVLKNRPIARQYRFILSISYDRLIFSAIAFIMLVIFVFSLGAERGKRLAMSSKSKMAAPIKIQESTETQFDIEKKVEMEPAKTIQMQPELPKPSQQIEPIKKVSKPYTIQVATYKSKSTAKKELDSLKKLGFDSFIISTNNKYEVCVGEYIDIDDAKKDIERLKKNYKDCFPRRR